MRGRKPIPTAIKILKGTQADRINWSEVKLPPGDLTAPPWLPATGRRHWDELAGMLKEAGLFTEADRPALALLCDAYVCWRHDPTDSKSRILYARMLAEFGMTPSARSRIKTTNQPKDALSDFLEKQAR
jgi:phage terminase small subunit